MTDSLDEKISALLDGELNEFEQMAAMTGLEKDEAQRKRWERYQVMSDALQRNLPSAIDPQFSARVMQALENEPAILAPHSKTSTKHPVSQPETTVFPWRRRVAGLAVAASVAMMGVFGVQTMNQRNPAVDPAVNQPLANLSVPQQNKQPNNQLTQVVEHKAQTSQADAAHQRFLGQHLNKYLLDHSQRAAQARVQGVMPYARIITYPPGAHQEQAGR